MNSEVEFVIQTFLVPTLLPDNYAHLPLVCPGCEADISVFLKKHRGRRWEERASVIRSLLWGVCCLWWQGSIISVGAPLRYFYTLSTTVLFLFSQGKVWNLHNSHPYLQVTQRATVCYTGTSGSVSLSRSVGFTKLKPIQVRHLTGGHWQILTKLQPAKAKANPDKSWDPVLSGQHKACGCSLVMANICLGYKLTFS